MWNLTIEKLENHKYRLLVKWDGTEEMLNGLLEDGFSVFDNNGVYFADYEDDSKPFTFGMSMCECYNKLLNNHLFTADYIIHCLCQTVGAKLIKEVEEKMPPYNLVKTLVDDFGMEATLRVYAYNYDSLVEEATQRYQNMDEVSFMDWLKESIDPRFTTQVAPEILKRYLDVSNIGTNLSGLYCGYWTAWQDVCDNWEVFKDWVNNSEYSNEVDFELFDSLINHKGNMKTSFYIVYFYGCGKLADILFGMLNDPNVLFKVKKFIQDVLKGCAQNDSEFAEDLQMFYSKYKSIAGGIDIDFAQQVFENEMFVFPEDDIKYHLSHDLYDEDEDGFIGMINPIYNDPEKLTRVFKELVKFNRVRPNELDTFVYRFTGQRKPKMIIDKIHWHGPEEDLLYLFKRFYGRYGEIKHFFDIEMKTAPKNYSAYAERATQALKDLFAGLFGIKNA